MRLGGGVQAVVALNFCGFTCQQGEGGRAPDVGTDAPVVGEQFGARDDFHQDGAGAHELDVSLAAFVFANGIQPLEDAALAARRHFRMGVVFVEQGEVVVHVFVFGVHAADAVTHDDRDFVGKGRVVGDAVRDERCLHVAVAVFVLQAFTVQRGAACGTAEEEAARALVACGPGEVAKALEAEHGVIDEEGDHRHAIDAVRRPGGNPVAHRAGFVDAFLQNLPVGGFFVEHQLVGIGRRVLLAERVPDAVLAEHAFHAEGAEFVRHDGHDVLAERLVFHQGAEDADERHRGGDFAAFFGGSGDGGEGFQRRCGQGGGAVVAFRHEALQLLAALQQVFLLR